MNYTSIFKSGFGLMAIMIFWITLFVCGVYNPDYDHFSNLVSELGAIGSPTRYLFSIGLSLTSFFSLLFVIDLYRKSKKKKINSIPILLILSFSLSVLGAGLVPMPLPWHAILGSPSYLLLLSPLFAAIFWHKKLNGILVLSLISLLIMLAGFLTLVPDVFSEYAGLKQRFFHLGWSVWFVVVSINFMANED